LKRLDFIFFDAGGGHRAAANALLEAALRQKRPWDVRLVNLQELLDRIDLFRKFTGLRLEDVYNTMLKKGWTLGSPQLTAGMHLLIRMSHPAQVRILNRFWGQSRPDMVVSLVPNFNRALYQSLHRTLPGVPLVTVLTDIADYPPHFWIERQPQYLVCGSDKAVEQARALGHAEDRIRRVSGMILHPRFYDLQPMDPEERAVERRRMGLDPGRPVGLVLFGGEGSSVMADIAGRLLPERQLILVCGRNAKLEARLRARTAGMPAHVMGFTRDVPRLMQLSDYLIGKPGPGSLSEALFMGLPVIVSCNAWTLPQERYNPVWLRERGVGLVLRSFRRIESAVAELLAPENYARFRAHAGAQGNRAVWEIPDILERLLVGAANDPVPASPR
jgi:hypothetical protein